MRRQAGIPAKAEQAMFESLLVRQIPFREACCEIECSALVRRAAPRSTLRTGGLEDVELPPLKFSTEA